MNRVGKISLVTVLLFFEVVRAFGAEGEEKAIWLAVTGEAFQEALEPLADKRRDDGFEVVISTKPVDEAISALRHRPTFILLVGDSLEGAEKESWYVGAQRFKVYRWRAAQRFIFVSDSAWGDFDGDLIPDVAVGRIPARTAAQVKVVVSKILAFERKEPSLDDLGLSIWAGRAEFGAIIDSITTSFLLESLRLNAPLWSRLWLISADPRHSLCGWPYDQGAMFSEQIKRGSGLGILIGHGMEDHFYSMRFKKDYITYTAADGKEAFSEGGPAGPLVIITCYSGNFAGRKNCLAESLLFMPGGPSGVIGATSGSHPLTNGFSYLCLLQELGGKERRLGDLWLTVQRRAIKMRNPLAELALLNVEGKLEEEVSLAQLRRDHILMYSLLGDPAMRLHLPEELHGEIRRYSDGWHWAVHKPEGAKKLHVSFRPEIGSFGRVMGRLEESSARRRFQEANASFGFKGLGELTAEQVWKGIINEEGVLRLSATGGKRLWAAALRLRFPEAAPATTEKAEFEGGK